MSNHLAPISPPDLITYRLGSKYVYVAPAPNYEDALDIARKEFPEELRHVQRNHITFNVSLRTSRGDDRTVRISESAWAPAMARLLRGDIIDVGVYTPPSDKIEPPPRYLDGVPPIRSQQCPWSQAPNEKMTHSRLRFWDKARDD